MIEVLINWIFISITAYAFGFLVFKFFLSILRVKPEEITNRNMFRILLGLVSVNVYAEIWSLFNQVGALADYILIMLSLLIVYINKDDVGKELRRKFSFETIVHIILIIIFAYGTSRGYMHFDTNLYHAQAIRWIEEYGVVPGLANLQSRFGYNSAEFALNALYSCKWFLGRSLHCSAGYFALISSCLLMEFKSIIIKNENDKHQLRIRISDYVRLGLFFYLASIYAEMISPASDYYAQLLVFDIVILWLNILEKEYSRSSDDDKERGYSTSALQGLLCIVLVYAVTIKLSLAPLLLLALVPGFFWIKIKDIKSIIACFWGGMVVAIPYFARNYIISGWILYPSTIIKLGRPEWQLFIGEAQYDAREIAMWGRGVTSAVDWEKVTMLNWIPAWIKGLSTVEGIWVMGALLSMIMIILLVIRCIIRKDCNQYMLLLIVVLCGTVFWFLSAPLVRYGYAYIIILTLFTLAYVLSDYAGIMVGINNTLINRYFQSFIFILLASGMAVLKGKGLISDIIRTKDYPYYISQQDYIDGEADSYIIDGIEIYVARDAGQIGYYKFPATPNKNTNIKLRSNDLKDGFMKK